MWHKYFFLGVQVTKKDKENKNTLKKNYCAVLNVSTATKYFGSKW